MLAVSVARLWEYSTPARPAKRTAEKKSARPASKEKSETENKEEKPKDKPRRRPTSSTRPGVGRLTASTRPDAVIVPKPEPKKEEPKKVKEEKAAPAEVEETAAKAVNETVEAPVETVKPQTEEVKVEETAPEAEVEKTEAAAPVKEEQASVEEVKEVPEVKEEKQEVKAEPVEEKKEAPVEKSEKAKNVENVEKTEKAVDKTPKTDKKPVSDKKDQNSFSKGKRPERNEKSDRSDRDNKGDKSDREDRGKRDDRKNRPEKRSGEASEQPIDSQKKSSRKGDKSKDKEKEARRENRESRSTRRDDKRSKKNDFRDTEEIRERKKKAPKKQEKKEEETIKTITLPETLTLSEFASKIKQPVNALIKKLFLEGKMYTVNTDLTYEEAELIALEYNIICEQEVKVDIVEEALKDIEDPEDSLVTRPPVVCVMGHVDHGKTSLLDAIRKTSVTEGEAGGITQHIGAYTVKVNDKRITFLDTPGHEAFTSMRLRGALATDIAILVVAADDGVMPQTIEAINHAKAAGVQIIVAVNKIDKPSANIERVKQELVEYGLVSEDWGGDTIFCPVSAKSHEGLDNLLEMILLTSDILELKANPNRKARGIVIEAKLDKGRGSVATLLVQKGTLKVGDFIAIGESHGRVRAMTDDKQRSMKEATPSMPVEVIGLSSVPNSGEIFIATDTEKEAKNMVGYMKTLFFRFLVSQLMFSHHITKNAYQFVPVQDCKQEWTDEKLNKKYGLSEEEVAFIDASIRAYD